MTTQTLSGNPAASGTESLRFHHSGKFRELLPIALLNFVLTVVTIGIYRFWARTRIRKYLWSRTTVLGDALEYTGKGSELFIGFLLSVLVFLLPLFIAEFAIEIIFGAESPLLILYAFFFYLFLVWLFGYALYSAQRFRMSRTYWRGIRAGLAGTRSQYAWKFLGYSLLTVLTLGLITPVRDVALYRHVMNNASFGNKSFSYTGTSGPVYGAFFLSILFMILAAAVYFPLAYELVIPSVDIGALMGMEGEEIDPEKLEEAMDSMMSFVFIAFLVLLVFLPIAALALTFYKARLISHFADKLTLDGASFALSPRPDAFSFIWLALGNIIIIILTFGFGLPFAQMRIFHYIVNRLQAEGAIDIDSIGQNELEPPKYGEGLAELFDAGTI